jgi:hypothetical protein
MYTASSDGKVCFTDLESGTSTDILDLNPDGWAVSSFNSESSIYLLKVRISAFRSDV